MSPILGIYASQISGHLFSLSGNYDALATVTVPSGGLSSITFAGIPTTGYTHLQLRVLSGTNPAGYTTGIRFNSDTGSNYYGHGLSGSGPGSVSGFSLGSGTLATISFSGITNTAFNAAVVDILDYTNVNKNKIIRSLNGRDNNGSGDIYLMSGSWGNTSAINSITIVAPSATFIEYSQFALYGVK
jgi:hypothetical protein